MRNVLRIIALSLIVVAVVACGKDEPWEYGDFRFDMVTFSGYDDGGHALFALLQRDDSRTDRMVDHESMAMELNNVLSKVLKDREITIIRECFGIGCHEKGLEEIGDQLGLTRERVRQIREKSIAKLRDSGNAKILMKYLG